MIESPNPVLAVVTGKSGWIYFTDLYPMRYRDLRPWRNRMALWCFEAHGISPEGEYWHLYLHDGGALTLRECIRRASQATEDLWVKDLHGWRPRRDS